MHGREMCIKKLALVEVSNLKNQKPPAPLVGDELMIVKSSPESDDLNSDENPEFSHS